MHLNSTQESLPALVFVHLGGNPAPTLSHMAYVAGQYFQEAQIFLITDRPETWQDFPGTVVPYASSQRSNRFSTFVKRHPELQGISGGYWLYTTERLFCLSTLQIFLSPDQPVIHLESDVYSMIDRNLFEKSLMNRPEGTWIPRYSADRGIGSIVFSTSVSQPIRDLDKLEELITENSHIDNDMDLLGMALNTNTFRELPTLLKQFKQSGEEINTPIIYDALALGQYLYGQDPLHTGGVRVSGYRNDESKFEFGTSQFALNFKDTPLGRVCIKSGDTEYQIANLHLHAKVTPDVISNSLGEWEKVITNANLGVEVRSQEIFPDLIHSKYISLPNRIRRARKVGYSTHLKRVFKYRLGRIMK